MDTSLIINLIGNEDFIDLIKCKICLLVSIDAVLCKKCESVFCRECINNWKKQKNNCPLRCNPLDLIDESRIIKNIKSKFYFKCERCMNKVSLDDHENHLKICNDELILCDKCGDYMQKSFLNTHLKLFCPNVLEICSNCNSKVYRKEFITNIIKSPKYEKYEQELKLKDEIISNLLKQKNEIISEVKCVENDILSFSEEKEITKLKLKEIFSDNKKLIYISFIEVFDNLLVIAYSNGEIIINDIKKNIITNKIKLHSDNFTSILKINNMFLTASFDNTLCSIDVLNITTFRTKLNYPVNAMINMFDVIIVGDMKGNISFLSFEGLNIILTKNIHNLKILSLKSHENNIISYSNDNTLCIIDCTTCNVIKKIFINTVLTDSIKINERIFYINELGDIYLFNNELTKVYNNDDRLTGNYKIFTFELTNKLYLSTYVNGKLKFFEYDYNFMKYKTYMKLEGCGYISIKDTMSELMKNAEKKSVSVIYSKKNNEYSIINAFNINI